MNNDVLKVILVDDEEQARFSLSQFLREYCSDIEILGEANCLPDAIKLINKVKPDVVFLDVQMPGLSGLQILDFFNTEDVDFQIIFVTAFSDYAVNAFKMSATDYLLKPLDIELLISAVDKAKKTKSSKITVEHLEALKSNLTEQNDKKIALPISGGILFVNASEIILAEAEGSYCKFYFQNGNVEMVSRKLKEYEDILLGVSKFFRPHRSFIINIDNIKQFVRADGGYLIMNNDMQVTISRDKKEELLQLINEKL